MVSRTPSAFTHMKFGCRVGDCLADVDPLAPQRGRGDPGPHWNLLDGPACHRRGAGLLDVVYIALHHVVRLAAHGAREEEVILRAEVHHADMLLAHVREDARVHAVPQEEERVSQDARLEDGEAEIRAQGLGEELEGHHVPPQAVGGWSPTRLATCRITKFESLASIGFSRM
jgi:hypothetical protein